MVAVKGTPVKDEKIHVDLLGKLPTYMGATVA